MVNNPDYTRRSLYNASKVIVEDDAITERLDQLISLEKEGHMFRIMSSAVGQCSNTSTRGAHEVCTE